MASRSTEDHKINKILLLDEYISQQTDRLIDLKAKINKEIDELPESEHRAVLRYRYCQRMKWAEIGELMGCSAKTARRIEQAALESFGVVNHQSIEKFTTP